MSVDNERREDHESQSVLERFADWYHVPALLVVMVAMLAIRLQSYGRFIRDGEVFFSGNDAWYHLRAVNYVVRHWPFTMPFDPWTNFPYGTSVGQFGTLYDQIIATVALILGLGSPSEALIAKTLLVAPAVFGALTVIPAYLIGKRLTSRESALFGALLLGLMPGVFLQRTLVGFADHNAAEPFFMSMAVAALMIALGVSEREMPVWELVADRDVDAIRSPLKWSVLAGVATALYMWAWPPGVLLVAILGAFVLVKMSSDVVNGRSPEATAFAVATSMLVTAALMIVQIDVIGFSSTQFSLVQPGLSLAVAAGAVFLAWLAREWEARDLDATAYPAAVLGLVVLGLGVVYLALPSVGNLISSNFYRILGFSANAQTRTIGEAQPYLSQSILNQLGMTPVNRIVADYGFTLFTGIAAVVWMLAKPLVKDGETREVGYVVGGLAVVGFLFLVPSVPAAIGGLVGLDGQIASLGIVGAIIVGAALLTYRDPEELLVVVWAAFITCAAFTQVRFNYYLAVVVVVLNAYLLGEILGVLSLRPATTKLSDVEGYQVAVIGAVLLLVAAPVLVVPLDVRNTGNSAFDETNTAWEAARYTGPGDVLRWEGSLDWLSEQTPPVGTYGGASNDMAYYGAYERTSDFDYPEGAYGVMSWWDYGHWITVEGHRIPNANPFQQGAVTAANFLLAPNESQAREVLVSQSTEGNQTRYVMIDWKMVNPDSKFGAPIVFYDASEISHGQFYQPVYRFDQQGRYQGHFTMKQQRYYESMMVRLYLYHGSARAPSPVVVDWEPQTLSTGQEVKSVPGGNESVVRTFDSVREARQYVQEDGTAQVGGIGPYPEERVSALEHYRLVKVSDSSATQSGAYLRSVYSNARAAQVNPQALIPGNPAWVKTFERVPGATVHGSGAPANATVTASVEMRVPTTNSTFTYTQRTRANQNGEFTFTLPYATTGYDQYGPENGYTNVSVRATGPYTIATSASINDSGYVVSHRGTLAVPEGNVNGAESGPLTVELQRSAQQLQIDTGSSDSGATDSETAGSGSTASGSSESGASARSSLAAPEPSVAPASARAA